MEPIAQQYIDAMQEDVEATREDCEAVANSTLLVLFLMGAELDPKMTWPPIVSNGVALWPLPSPYDSGTRRTVPLLVDLNGTGEEGGYLSHCKKNAEEYNVALAESKPDVARAIAKMGPTDSAFVWNNCNALALSVADEAGYGPLQLSEETKAAFYLASGSAR